MVKGRGEVKFLLLRTAIVTVALGLSAPAFSAVHAPQIKSDCNICHDTKSARLPLKSPLSGLCLGCHPGWGPPTGHIVDLVPSMEVNGLPLQDGRMTCVTCHDPHGKAGFGKMLRAKADEICHRCHQDL